MFGLLFHLFHSNLTEKQEGKMEKKREIWQRKINAYTLM